MKTNHYLKEHLVWKPHPVKPYYFTHFKNDTLLLRKNEGNGQAQYTLAHHLELIQLDHFPRKWKIDGAQVSSSKPKS